MTVSWELGSLVPKLQPEPKFLGSKTDLRGDHWQNHLSGFLKKKTAIFFLLWHVTIGVNLNSPHFLFQKGQNNAISIVFRSREVFHHPWRFESPVRV